MNILTEAAVLTGSGYFIILRGNWSTDLLAGSEFGYKLLFVVLVAGLGAVVLQASAQYLLSTEVPT